MTQPNSAVIALALAIFSAPSIAQVYRCKGPNGVEMQQVPCAGQGEKLDVRPANGQAALPALAQSPSSPSNSGAGARPRSRVELHVESMQDERLRRESWFEMTNKKAYLAQLITQCSIEQQRIGSERMYSRNNLAGATRDVSITNEMKAAASLCDTKTRLAERDADQAIAHCEKIKCIAQN